MLADEMKEVATLAVNLGTVKREFDEKIRERAEQGGILHYRSGFQQNCRQTWQRLQRAGFHGHYNGRRSKYK